MQATSRLRSQRLLQQLPTTRRRPLLEVLAEVQEEDLQEELQVPQEPQEVEPQEVEPQEVEPQEPQEPQEEQEEQGRVRKARVKHNRLLWAVWQ